MGQGLKPQFSTVVRHEGDLDLDPDGFLLWGFFLDFEFYGGCILADRSPPSSRVTFISASSCCRVNYT